MEILDRVRLRLTGEQVEDAVLGEYVTTISDRLCIRLGETTLPATFQSICVDAVVKMYRRLYYEGISSEGSANLSTSFVDNVLAEYDSEISDWKLKKANSGSNDRVVRLL